MIKTKITLLISFLFLGLFFVFTPKVNAEIIRSFSSTINVLGDSSILVNEKISYDFETSIRHGIYRTIPLRNSKGEEIEIKIISIVDQDGKENKFTTDTKNKILTIQIGDPDKMISGIKEYNLTYQVWGSVNYFENFDEIYWNVTGNDWQVPILKTEAKVVLPNNVFPIQQSCYLGAVGSKTKCNITTANIFSSEITLNAGEGLTVAVGFPKGVVSVYAPKQDSSIFKFIKTFWPVVIPIIVFALMFIRWQKKGRDPKGTGVIIPQYDVPDNLTPLEVGGIINEQIKNQNISAEIIYLATKGYLKIKKIDKKEGNFLGLVLKDDYEFVLLKEIGFLSNNFDKEILIAIFGKQGKVGGVAKMSGLNNIFYKSIPTIDNNVSDVLLSKKYYTNFPKARSAEGVLIVFLVFITFFLVGTVLDVKENFEDPKKLFILVFSFIISITVGLILNYLMPAKSVKGVSTKEYLLGLKDYLQIAEKDRLNFHNAPEKKPEVFEALLPYAMVFGVEKLWAKEFDGIYIKSPEWYEDKSSGFNIVHFGLEMAMFNTLATSSLSSYPGSSGGGSGGGGFSGGGGGGGGGGSW